MADITMCTVQVCKNSKTCYRFNAKPSSQRQSYLADPEKDCQKKDYQLYEKDGGPYATLER